MQVHWQVNKNYVVDINIPESYFIYSILRYYVDGQLLAYELLLTIPFYFSGSTFKFMI